MSIAGNFEFNVANAERITAAANSVFMVVYKFVAGNADARKCLEEAVNRAVAAADNHLDGAVFVNISFKAGFRGAVHIAQFRKAVLKQRVFAFKLSIFFIKELYNLLFFQFVAVSIRGCLDDCAKFRVHFFRQAVTAGMFQHKGCAALAGLAVNADNGFIFTVNICRINWQIRYFPIRSFGSFHIIVAFADGILMGAGKSGKGKFAGIGLAFMHVHFGAFFVNIFNFQNITEIKLRVYTLSEHIECNCYKVKVAGTLAVAEQRAFHTFCACHDGKFCRSNCRAAVIMRMNAYDSSFPVMQVFAEVFNLVGISVGCGHFYR